MKVIVIKSILVSALLISVFDLTAHGQEYVSPTQPAQTGKSPGVKVKLLSTGGESKTYVLIFSAGDELRSGLTEFALKYDVKSAHYTAIGDASSVKLGWYDYDRKMFKVIPVNEPAEVSSLTGDIAIFNGKPVAHTHVNVATADGISHGGHLLEMIVGPTLEVFLTVEPTALYKKYDSTFHIGVIDPSLEK